MVVIFAWSVLISIPELRNSNQLEPPSGTSLVGLANDSLRAMRLSGSALVFALVPTICWATGLLAAVGEANTLLISLEVLGGLTGSWLISEEAETAVTSILDLFDSISESESSTIFF